jgi:hypothetical protein
MATPLYDEKVAIYKYFTADVLSNQVIAEISFKSVSYERAIKGAGKFSGRVPVFDGNSSLNLYENTMPGKTALYVVRNDVCVWGGIIWDRSYNAKQKELSVSASEFTSYLYHRNIWKTVTHDIEASVVVTSGVAQVTLVNFDYEAPAGSSVRLIFYEVGDFQYNGYYVVNASPAPTTSVFYVNAPSVPNGTYSQTTVYIRTDAYDYMRQLIDETLADFTNIIFPNNEIEPGVTTTYTVTNKSLSSNTATLTTSTAHNFFEGQVAEIRNIDSTFDGDYEVSTVPSSNTFTYSKTAANVASTAVSSRTYGVVTRQYTQGLALLQTNVAHDIVEGNIITVSGVDPSSAFEKIFDGTFIVESVPSNTVVTYHTFGVFPVEADTPSSGTIAVARSAISATYGPFPANSDIVFEYSDYGYADKNLENKTYRGFELRSVGEELDQYSDSIDGFEYRIDCDYDPVSGSFTKTFVFLPINFPNPPAAGEVSPVSRFGADELVFEFPGNINDIDIKESAENSATRFFIVGNIPDLGNDISQPYSVASATDLLRAGWPILDQEETKQDISDEDELYSHAQRYLNEFRPPVGDISIRVNGSLQPIVGSYFPGDWCSIIADDEFIRQRLSSDLEIRDTVLVRKIDAIKVSVPDTPSFPEEVTLDLITEWEVDKRGE